MSCITRRNYTNEFKHQAAEGAEPGSAAAPRQKLRLIQLGKPNQNAYGESFNGRMCDERLNKH